MKKLVVLLAFVLLCSLSIRVKAQDTINVGLKWDANTELDLAGYRVYERDVNSEYGVHCKEVDANTITVILEGVSDHLNKRWAVTAFDTQRLESGRSNEVGFGEAPANPNGLGCWKED